MSDIVTMDYDKVFGTSVFVLGAGCSNGYGVPLMKDFIEKARALRHEEKCPLLSVAYDMSLDYRDKCGRISQFFDRWWDDIEELYTQAQLTEIRENTGRELSNAISFMIWNVCRQRCRNPKVCDYQLFANALYKMAMCPCPRPVVITTNYDANLEHAIITHDPGVAWGQLLVSYPGFDQEEHGFQKHSQLLSKITDPLQRAIEVIKLHGSVNWFEKDNQPVLRSKLADAEDSKAIFEFQQRFFKYENFFADQHRPLIVPPGLTKASPLPAIESQWRCAMHALEYSKDIFIVGYSFPATDVFMTRLLAEGLRDSKELNRITIVNPEESPRWWSRIEDLFSKSWWTKSVIRSRFVFPRFVEGIKTCLKDKDPLTREGIGPRIREHLTSYA